LKKTGQYDIALTPSRFKYINQYPRFKGQGKFDENQVILYNFEHPKWRKGYHSDADLKKEG